MTTEAVLLFDTWLIFKVGFIAFFVLYFFFSLIVVRQVSLMTETLITAVSPLLRILSTAHALISLGVLIFMIFYLF